MGGKVHASVHYWVAGPGHDIEGSGTMMQSDVWCGSFLSLMLEFSPVGEKVWEKSGGEC